MLCVVIVPLILLEKILLNFCRLNKLSNMGIPSDLQKVDWANVSFGKKKGSGEVTVCSCNGETGIV